MKLNPELKKGDRVTLIEMSDESSVSFGDSGTVISKSVIFDDVIYSIKWDNGSMLNLLSDVDKWMLEEDYNDRFNKKKRIKENRDERIIERLPMIKHFNRIFLQKYLLKLRDSGITNMMVAAPYLWMGRDRLEHEMKYKNIPNEEIFEELLGMADQSQAEMISGTISYLEEKGQELDLNNINRDLRRNSSEIVGHYIDILS